MSTPLNKAVLPLIVLAAAIAVAALMMANRVTPDRLEVGEQAVPVETAAIEHTTETVVVTAQGTITAAQQIQLRPEVAGRIVDISPAVVPGGRLAAGRLAVAIDDRDYRVAVAAREEGLARARLALEQEQARRTVAEEEWELLEESIPAADANRDLALRIPQIEQATAAVKAAEGALAKAHLDLERCTVTAPFNAIVLREQVDLGQVVGPQVDIATLVGTDTYWVQLSLPLEHLEWITVPGGTRRRGSAATVIHRAGSLEIRREGHVERLLGDVDPAGRMARLLVVIDDPLEAEDDGAGLPLLLGSYVTVEIQGRSIEDAVVIPRRALREVHRDGDNGASEGLWIMDEDDRLTSRKAQVVWRTEETVIISNGFTDGERLVTSAIAAPIEGMKLVAVETGAGADD